MVLSRALTALRGANLLRNAPQKQLQLVRNSHVVNYRSGGPTPPKAHLMWATFVGGVAWWWIFWHVFTEPGHLFGEFPYPDPRKWSDEELGIPPAE